MKKNGYNRTRFYMITFILSSVFLFGYLEINDSYSQNSNSHTKTPLPLISEINSKSSQASITNLTKIFGEPIYKEWIHNRTSSIVEDVDNSIITEDSYIAYGHLKNIGNVTDKATYLTTHKLDGISTSSGKGIMTTANGEIATYTGNDVGTMDENETETFRGFQIFSTDSDGELAFLNNLVGIYVYKYYPNGTTTSNIWEWK
jgi:hypothetical protein